MRTEYPEYFKALCTPTSFGRRISHYSNPIDQVRPTPHTLHASPYTPISPLRPTPYTSCPTPQSSQP
jgi:hypothetical protein